MLFIVSPAKKMKLADESFAWRDLPHFINHTEVLMDAIRQLDARQAQDLWLTSDALTELNFERFRTIDARGQSSPLSPAICAYEGIQYQHLAAAVMETDHLTYLQDHLRILSGFYGVLRPFDGVAPYRLEMQAKLAVGEHKDLYSFWGSSLFDVLVEQTDIIVNLASVEYAKAIRPYAQRDSRVQFVTCLFGHLREGKLIQRAVAAKAARGSMVRWCAEEGIEHLEELRAFSVGGYEYSESLSNDNTLVFAVG